MEPETTLSETDTTLSEPAPQEKELTMIVDGLVLDVSWEDNETVAELLSYAKSGTITVNTMIYGGFEQVGSLPQSFSRNDIQMTTDPGDIVLYSGNQLVVFFSSNTWSYTKLGHINIAAEPLAELLGGDTAVIEFKYE
ncbi:MAG: cyclophilin-like fold protein [Butyricicoccaceae bacterium]